MNTGSHASAGGTRRSARFLRAGVIAAAVVLAATGAVGASAEPAPSSPPASAGTIPPLPPPPAQNQAAIVAAAGYAAKPHFAFATPVQFQRVYAAFFAQYGEVTTTDSAAYVLQNPGPDPVYGVFPDIRKTIPGFGAIPVTATIRLGQTVDATGTLNRLLIHNVATSRADGSAPSVTTVTGQLTIQLLDVEVDQVPLDVGDNCKGSAPIDLVLNGSNAAIFGEPKPTDYDPFTGGPLTGTFTIPTFSGCGVDGQDLDPLFDGTVSGPDNLISLNQGPLGEWDPTSRNGCRKGNGRPCNTPSPVAPLPSPSGR